MPNIENMPRPEIIQVADTVAREKNIDKEDVFAAMEVAIQKAGRSRYGFEHDIVIDFARMCEKYPQGEQWDKALRVLVECHEASPYCEDDE